MARGGDRFAEAAQRELAAGRAFPAYEGTKLPKRADLEREAMALLEQRRRRGKLARDDR